MTTIAEQLIQRGEARGRAEGIAEGQAKAKAEALLTVLEARQLLIEEAERTRIVECRNLADLDRWFHRALRANRVSDLFEP